MNLSLPATLLVAATVSNVCRANISGDIEAEPTGRQLRHHGYKPRGHYHEQDRKRNSGFQRNKDFGNHKEAKSQLKTETDEHVSEEYHTEADNADQKIDKMVAPVAEDEPGDDEEHQWPLLEEGDAQQFGHGRKLAEGSDCGIFTDDDDGSYFHPQSGECYNLGDNWWDDKVTWIRASSGTCVDVWEHHEGGNYQRHCGIDWIEVGSGLSRQVSRVCCPAKQSPVTSCTGNGGTCGCGKTTDGQIISMNRFWGDNNDEQVFGCGGAFQLTGASWDSQWGGTLSAAGPEATVLHNVGVDFSQSASYDGWEGCCMICGVNLQIAGKISDGWYCEKDTFATGIWLKGVNKQ